MIQTINRASFCGFGSLPLDHPIFDSFLGEGVRRCRIPDCPWMFEVSLAVFEQTKPNVREETWKGKTSNIVKLLYGGVPK